MHLDRPLERRDAERLVFNPSMVACHAFLPLISFQKKERRYRRASGCKKPIASIKVRELAYPSNRDGHVFAYYSEMLGKLYEAELASCGLGDVVIGYRKKASNIRLARDAFQEIITRSDCVALAFDIKGFFDNIDHGVLKEAWSYLLRKPSLPRDHYSVFKALTSYAKMDRSDLLRRLSIKTRVKDRDLPKPLCSMGEFRRLRRSQPNIEKLVKENNEPFGIPQGTPLSAMAANISMLRFDAEINGVVAACGGSYRRYSDDILVLCSVGDITMVESAIESALQARTKTLKLNRDKSEKVHFLAPGPRLAPVRGGAQPKPLQYLGFTFDGQHVRIRSGTLARYHRRLATSAQAAKIQAALAKRGKLTGRDTLHKREVLAKHSHLGKDSFVSGYVKQAQAIMSPIGSNPIRRQVARHMETLTRKLGG